MPCLVFFILAMVFLVRLYSLFTTPLTYTEWGVSEWMINYAGGFVRRGLSGQVLWSLYNIHPFNLLMGIRMIIFLSSILILILVIRVFWKEKLSLLLLPIGCFFNFTLFSTNARKDFLLLLFAYVLFYSFHKLITKSTSWRWGLVFLLSSVIMLLIHEASFFFTFPFLALFGWYYWDKKDKNILYRILYFIPCVVVFIMVIKYKGDSIMAQKIWNSWASSINSYPDNGGQEVSQIGLGVAALGWNAIETFKNHLSWSYLGIPPSLLKTPFVFLNLFSLYYLVTRVNTANPRFWKLGQVDTIALSNILIVQFIFLLPMYTILSCDWGRTLPYMVITTFFLYHIFKNIEIVPIVRFSEIIQKKIDDIRLLNSSYFYIFILIFTPFSAYHAPSLENELLYRMLHLVGIG